MCSKALPSISVGHSKCLTKQVWIRDFKPRTELAYQWMPNERKMNADLVRSPRFDFNL